MSAAFVPLRGIGRLVLPVDEVASFLTYKGSIGLAPQALGVGLVLGKEQRRRAIYHEAVLAEPLVLREHHGE
jgi:hypothetical protein